MHDMLISSGRDSFLIALPFLAIMLAGLFRVDEAIASPRRNAAKHHRSMCGVDEKGQQILCDPDGQRWYPSRGEK